MISDAIYVEAGLGLVNSFSKCAVVLRWVHQRYCLWLHWFHTRSIRPILFWTTRTGRLETRSWVLIECCCEILYVWGRSIPQHGIHWMAGIYLIIGAYKLTASIESSTLFTCWNNSRAPWTNLLISTSKNTTWVGRTNEFLQKCVMQWQWIEFTSVDLVAMAKAFFLLLQDATILQQTEIGDMELKTLHGPSWRTRAPWARCSHYPIPEKRPSRAPSGRLTGMLEVAIKMPFWVALYSTSSSWKP
jgi:hypothetical protein